jgi:hypothetical protein
VTCQRAVAPARLQRDVRHGWPEVARSARRAPNRKETIVVPILLWFLGIPGIIIILLLLLGVISF